MKKKYYFCSTKKYNNMISFLISIGALILGYIIYGAFVERIFGPDNRKTPAVAHPDGVDYIAMPTWKVFMIQFLNIAGTGPIFGAIMGAWFGPASFLWIVIGCIFAGSVHDYLSGMLSLRHDGAGLPELVGKYMGNTIKIIMLVFSMLLLLLVGAVFVTSPAGVLASMGGDKMLWVVVIFIYYVIATLLPIDKVIGKIYPIFAISLIFMALGLFVCLLIKMPHIPELWDINNMDAWRNAQINNGVDLLGANKYLSENSIFPIMFITIACGAISGFHATQSPLMARCLKNEKLGRPVFYGSMITEGFVALVWAAVSSWFFYNEGWRDVMPQEDINKFLAQVGNTNGKTLIQLFDNPAEVVNYVCKSWLGIVGGALALLGVVAAPITSGDTALRSARLIMADFLKLNQKPIVKRLMIAIPMFAAVILLLTWQNNNPDGFKVLWNYFGWLNQTLSVFTLWTITIYLYKKKKFYWVTLIPAMFMTAVSLTFIVQKIIA